MTRLILSAIAGAAALASAPLAEAPVRACRSSFVEGDGIYPDHSLSPQESYRVHDAVFWAEVSVPARPCSLGTCAGLNVLQVLKGRPQSKVLVQIAQPLGTECPATLFTQKNTRWIVFANTGTSRTGYGYLQVEDEGPTFLSQRLPNLQALEGRFRKMRARLDEVINERLGTLR
jgi:hypothetical protein